MPLEVLLSVHSDEIVFANDLRALVAVPDHHDLNSVEGGRAFTRSAAEQGLALIFVGNTCPSVYRDGHGLCGGAIKARPDTGVFGNHGGLGPMSIDGASTPSRT